MQIQCIIDSPNVTCDKFKKPNGPTLGECSRGTVTPECEIVGYGVLHTAFKALEYGPGPKH